jgi:hypothetical protein
MVGVAQQLAELLKAPPRPISQEEMEQVLTVLSLRPRTAAAARVLPLLSLLRPLLGCIRSRILGAAVK